MESVEIREFAAHTLLRSEGARALTRYFEGFLDLAQENGTGLILDTVTWKAHRHWASRLSATDDELESANEESVRFIADLPDRSDGNAMPIVLNGVIGPRGDAYRPAAVIAMDEA